MVVEVTEVCGWHDIRRATSVWHVAWARLLDLGREESGAALVITLAMFSLMYLACCGVFAVSTAVKERIQLQNAADAAVYSAAVVQADTLSRIATLNRAMAWTYVQMTRRQMDYIVLRWLTHTVRHYEDDSKGASAYNRGGVFGGPCGRHGSCGVGWFIGTNPRRMETMNRVRLNGLGMESYLGLDEIPGFSALAGAFGNVGSAPPLSTVKRAIRTYKVSNAYQALSSFGESGKGMLSSGGLVDEILSIRSDNEPYSNIETIRSVIEMLKNISPQNGRYEGGGDAVELMLQWQIVFDRLSIALMNVMERHLARDLPGHIAEVVRNIVVANVPGHLAADCLYLLDQNTSPLDGEITGVGSGYFGNLYNNVQGERRFLAFADYYDPLVDVFIGASGVNAILLSRSAAGVNQWFVRGDGKQRTEGVRGLQRCYKHWAEGPFSNIHASHSPLPPSCWNTEKNFLEGSPGSIALHSEWAWWSDVWCCRKILWRRIHLRWMPHKKKMWPMKVECDHNGNPGLFGGAELSDSFKALGDAAGAIGDIETLVKGMLSGRKDADGQPIPVDEGVYNDPTNSEALDDAIAKAERQILGDPTGLGEQTGDVSDLPGFSSTGIEKYDDGCLLLWPVLNGTEHVVGYGRLYADAPAIYNACYVGERAKPLIVRPAYFGKAGTISVGIRRQNGNVFARIVGMIDGFLRAFDPDWNGAGTATHTYVFASAKAGYKNKGDPLETADYRIDWRPNDQGWNLCQSDWDAVFVPVRMAKAMAAMGHWLFDDENVLENWVSDDGAWRTLDGGRGDVKGWNAISAPRGVRHAGTLDWRGVSHVLYH